MNTQKSLPLELKKYILHKKQIMESSANYRQMAKFNSLGKCLEIVTMIRRNAMNNDIVKMALIYRQHLENILPHPANRSYNSSYLTLQGILTDCKTSNKC